MRETEILHHLLTCLSTLSLAVRGYKLCISKCKLIEVVQDFFHPPKKKKEFLYIWSCKFLPAVSNFQGINSIVGSSHSPPTVLQPHATLQTTRNTHATLHATLHTTLPKCCQGQHFGSGQKNRLVFSFHSLKAAKLQNAAPASSSVVLRVV